MKKSIKLKGFSVLETLLRREAWLRESQPQAVAGIVQAADINSTDLPAWSSWDPHARERIEVVKMGWMSIPQI